jgi:hypothetical protein
VTMLERNEKHRRQHGIPIYLLSAAASQIACATALMTYTHSFSKQKKKKNNQILINIDGLSATAGPARRPREPSGSATWAPRCDRGGQTPTGRRQRTTQLPFMNRVNNDSPYTGLPGPPSLVFCFVFVFVRAFVCVSVRMFVRCRMHA